MNYKLFLVYAAMVVSLVGCVGYGTYQIAENSFPSTNAGDVRVYAVTQPDAEYTVIGYVSVYISDAQDGGNRLRDELKSQAAKLGADAIIGFKLNLVHGGGGGAEGEAIRYKH